MGVFHLALSGLVSILAYALLVFSVYKIYQIAGEISEIKEIVRDLKRNADSTALANLTPGHSAEALVRAVNAASFDLSDSEPVPGSTQTR